MQRQQICSLIVLLSFFAVTVPLYFDVILTHYPRQIIWNSNDDHEADHGADMRRTQKLSDNKSSIDEHRRNNWIIIMTLNGGYFDFFINWFAAYRNLCVDIPLAVITEDKVAYTKLKELSIEGITIKMSNFGPVNETVSYGSKSFNDLSIRRHTYILQYLISGRNVIFSDTDTVWIKNPISFFTGKYDMWMQIDGPGSSNYCPGTMAILSNNETIKFFSHLTKHLALNPQPDQPYINTALEMKSHAVRVKGLNSTNFPSGRQYFTRFNAKQRSEVVVVHNNWIKGYKAKLERFKKFSLWSGYFEKETLCKN